MVGADVVNANRRTVLVMPLTAAHTETLWPVMVGVKADAIWNYLHATPPPGAVAEAADHEISVIAINATTRTVYVNDSGLEKGGVAVPLNVFMRAWQSDSYETTTAVLAEAASAGLAA